MAIIKKKTAKKKTAKKKTIKNRNLKSAQAKNITEISIVKLFGYSSYTIPLNLKNGNLSIVYGDNGAGKTTILTLLFRLLSPVSGRGDKTFVAQTPFEQFTVKFDNGISVRAYRKSSLVGSFTVEITKDGKKIFSLPITASEDNTILPENVPKIPELEDQLREIGIELYFLPDDRRVRTTFPNSLDPSASNERYSSARERYDHIKKQSREKYSQDEKTHHLNIRPVLDQVNNWIRTKAITASHSGEQNTNSVYLSVLNSLVIQNNIHSESSSDSVSKFEIKLKHIAERSEQFSIYDFATIFPAKKYISLLRAAQPEIQSTIMTVLDARVDGIIARLDALEKTMEVVSTFINSINQFFHQKTITFNLRHGLCILDREGFMLEPNNLSSGEKQLLLLLSNTILARDTATVFIIDEPELSLNIKWQRLLVEALIKCSEGSDIQYIMASHSIQLFSEQRDSVCRLIET